MGLTPRTTRVSSKLFPYEATSFPAFSYKGLLEEAWEDSDLLAQVEYMLFLPVVGERKQTPQGECIFESPRFWRPSAADIELMRREWEYSDFRSAGPSQEPDAGFRYRLPCT